MAMHEMAADAYQSQISRAPQSAFGSATEVMDEARSLARRVSDIVDRLCGSQPQAVSNGTKLGGSGAVLGNLRDEADRTAEAIREAVAQLNRLDRELP